MGNRWWINGWTYMGRCLLEDMVRDRQMKLAQIGNAITVDQGDRWIRYVNNGMLTASSKKVVIDFHRRFKPRSLSRNK